MVNLHKLIAAISPETYCDPKVIKEVKEIVKEKGYLEAAKKAKPTPNSTEFNFDDAKSDPFKKWGLQGPVEKHKIVYDSPSEGLEPIYFWILDFVRGIYNETEKLVDNFASSPGSGHFSELQGKATRMQEESMKILGGVNQTIKSILNIIYDLKEFKIRLDPYKKLKSNDKKEKAAAFLSLKQIWMDNVDIKRGQGSINALAANMDFVTVRDAFLAAKSTKAVDEIDLNERVKRILRQRVSEFEKWLVESERELTKRFEIERKYLHSQYSTVQLYSRWLKPYLQAATKLEQNSLDPESLVTVFNTLILELTLLTKSLYKPDSDVSSGTLPEVFKKTTKKKYYSIQLIELKFRGIPQKAGQHYTFGGRTEITFTSYALTNQELEVLHNELKKDDVNDVMKLIQGATTDSLDALKEDIDEFLGEEKSESSKKKKEEKSRDTNPFSALFSFIKFPDKKGKKGWDVSKPLTPDSKYEQIIRSQAIISARELCYLTFDVYKKAHQMPSHDSHFEVI